MLTDSREWNLPLSYKIRGIAYVVFLALLMAAYLAGISTPLTPDKAEELYLLYNQSVSEIMFNVTSVDQLGYRIFRYEIRVIIACAAPGLGAFMALYAQYISGLTLKAVAIVEHRELSAEVALTMTEPVMWLESIALAILAVESLIAAYAMIRGRLNVEIGIYLSSIVFAASLFLFSSGVKAAQILAELGG